MPDNEPAGAPALVTGASLGFGRGIAAALSRAGAQVARDRSPLEELSAELGGSFIAVTADAAADPASHVADVQPQLGHRRSHVFHWTGEALRGSPLSGGYAGAKTTIRFISSYAAAEAGRDGLGIRFVSVLPQLTPRPRWAPCTSLPTPPGRVRTRRPFWKPPARP